MSVVRCSACRLLLTSDDVASGACPECRHPIAQPAAPAPSGAPAAPPPSSSTPSGGRWGWKKIAVLLLSVAIGGGFYALTRFLAPNGWAPQPAEIDTPGVQRTLEGIEEGKRQEVEKVRQKRAALETELIAALREVRDETAARNALKRCSESLSANAVMAFTLAWGSSSEPQVTNATARETLEKIEKSSPTTAALIAELKRIDREYPAAYSAVSRARLEKLAHSNRSGGDRAGRCGVACASGEARTGVARFAQTAPAHPSNSAARRAEIGPERTGRQVAVNRAT